MADDPKTKRTTDKWTEIEHLPKWDEEFYEVYTARKYGKWVMLKTLKPQYKGIPEYDSMIEKEFEVRYNLAHPHIIMINDFEDVPGLGMCIITDDVYGDSLRTLIDNNAVTSAHIDKLKHQLVDAMEYIQNNHLIHNPIRPESIIFTENIGNLKLLDVGFDQKTRLSNGDTSADIFNYGKTVLEALDHCDIPDLQMRKIAQRCINPDPRKRFRNAQDIHLAIENRGKAPLLFWLLAFLIALIAVLRIVSRPDRSNPAPDPSPVESVIEPVSVE